jgi:type I restriction enzyme S subunit
MSEVVNIPQLRFPEFSDAWEEKNVGDVLTIGSGRDYKHLNNGDIPVYGTGGYMTSVDSFLYDGESVCIGRKGTIDKPVLIDGKFWTVDTLFYTHSFVDLLPKFLFPLFKRINWKKYNEASGVPSLSKSTIEKIKLSLPTKPEQQKIAAFLTTVDSKIEQLSKKQELLGSWKKGLMQQIFSQATRFKADDGCDFPDWEEKKLGDVSVRGTSNISANQLEDNNGDYKIYGAAGHLKNIDFYTEEDCYVAIVKDGAGVGRIMLLESKTSVLGTLAIIKAKQGNDINFLYWLIQTINFRKYVVGSTIPHIYYRDYQAEKLRIPSLSEQTKIANFLSFIDSKIEQVGKQLDESKQFKKALLQQMFV